MSSYNYIVTSYIVTAQNPTAVGHSCFGKITGPEYHNLIVAKCTHIEVHLVTQGRPQILFNVPIYGKISTLDLFRPRAICDTSGTSDGTSSGNSCGTSGTDSDTLADAIPDTSASGHQVHLVCKILPTQLW